MRGGGLFSTLGRDKCLDPKTQNAELKLLSFQLSIYKLLLFTYKTSLLSKSYGIEFPNGSTCKGGYRISFGGTYRTQTPLYHFLPLNLCN